MVCAVEPQSREKLPAASYPQGRFAGADGQAGEEETQVVYKWSDSARHIGVQKFDPQPIGTRIEQIRVARGGDFKDADVLDDARNPQSPLHQVFEWDNSEAGEQYRLYQARVLVASIVSAPLTNSSSTEPVRVFVSVRQNHSKSYRTLSEVLSDDQLREKFLRRAFADLKLWERKYAKYEELVPIFEVAKQQEQKIQKQRRAAKATTIGRRKAVLSSRPAQQAAKQGA